MAVDDSCCLLCGVFVWWRVVQSRVAPLARGLLFCLPEMTRAWKDCGGGRKGSSGRRLSRGWIYPVEHAPDSHRTVVALTVVLSWSAGGSRPLGVAARTRPSKGISKSCAILALDSAFVFPDRSEGNECFHTCLSIALGGCGDLSLTSR